MSEGGDTFVCGRVPSPELCCPLLPFFSSLQLLRKCILQMTRPVVEGSLGSPPFEKPNIEQVGWGRW